MTAKQVTVWEALRGAARRWPEQTFLHTRDRALTYGETLAEARQRASALRERGVSRGDRGLIVMGNSIDHAITWFALNALGAVAVPLNAGLTDVQLVHQIGVADPSFVAADDTQAHRVDAMLQGRRFRGVARTVQSVPIPRGWEGLDELASITDPDPPGADGATAAEDIAMVLFTSGTTGPSKGCILSNRYLVGQGELLTRHLGLRQTDVLYCPFPMFHADAISYTIMAALAVGGTAAIAERYSTSNFWDDIAFFGATVFDFMGATLTMLHQAPAGTDDRDNSVRLAWGVPVPPFADEFEERFDLRIVELYGSTDAGIPIVHPLHLPRRPGSCGQVIPEYEIRVVDSEGAQVDGDAVGELEIRSHETHLMSDGYLGMPEATKSSRRAGWFRSGDLVRRDEDGWIYFVSRSNDVIRRRGENLSALEVESVVGAHPSVGECAAYGVASPLTEEDVMVVFSVVDGSNLQPRELAEFCAENLPPFMVPRYLRRVDVLPHTPTAKVAKSSLKAEGVTPGTWDRENPATFTGASSQS